MPKITFFILATFHIQKFLKRKGVNSAPNFSLPQGGKPTPGDKRRSGLLGVNYPSNTSFLQDAFYHCTNTKKSTTPVLKSKMSKFISSVLRKWKNQHAFGVERSCLGRFYAWRRCVGKRLAKVLHHSGVRFTWAIDWRSMEQDWRRLVKSASLLTTETMLFRQWVFIINLKRGVFFYYTWQGFNDLEKAFLARN